MIEAAYLDSNKLLFVDDPLRYEVNSICATCPRILWSTEHCRKHYQLTLYTNIVTHCTGYEDYRETKN